MAASYETGAKRGGHEVRRIEVASLEFPFLRSRQDFESGTPPRDIAMVQDATRWADHVVIPYPLWLGTMPAILKALVEQTARPGFAFAYGGGGTKFPEKLLKGRSARIVATMGMPAFVYRWFYFAHGLRNLERNILKFIGIAPIRESLLGMVTAASPEQRARWLERLNEFGSRGF
jgi:putative NADPH-quinone reductase